MIYENVLFSSLTTLRIGGPIRYLVAAAGVDDIFQSIEKAKDENLPWIVIGGGSNLLVSDTGFNGYVIQNLIHSIENKDGFIEVGSGIDLQQLVGYTVGHGISGFEKLIGIPGTVGGAVYGNAGAYGQGISDKIEWVEVLELKSGKTKKLKKEECGFVYRESIFRETHDIILKVGFSTARGDIQQLSSRSREIIAMRMQKYPPGISCPGSFFKNVEADKLSPEVLKNIPADKIMHGKIPAGWLLEKVGAKGASRGGVEIAQWHGNLFMNIGRGTASDFIELAREYKQKVLEKFGIELAPEVQLVGFGGLVL